jgi:hypothetical protein
MSQFALIIDNNIVFGPMHWAPEIFGQQLTQLGFNISLTVTPPIGVLDFGNGIVIVPVKDSTIPSYNPQFQTIENIQKIKNNIVEITYKVKNKELSECRNFLLNKIAMDRFNKEISGLEIQGIRFPTSRESRMIIQHIIETQKDNLEYFNFKASGNNWLELTVEQLIKISQLIGKYVQQCYDEERSQYEVIMAAKSVEELMDLG